MPTDIHERAQLTRRVAHHKNRNRRQILGQVVTGIRNLRAESHNDRMMPKKHFAFARRPLRRRVRGSIVARKLLSLRRRTAIDSLEDLTNQPNLRRMFHDSLCTSRYTAKLPRAEGTRPPIAPLFCVIRTHRSLLSCVILSGVEGSPRSDFLASP